MDILKILDEEEQKQKDELEEKTDLIVTEARELKIQNEEQYKEAGELLKKIKAFEKEVERQLEPIVKKAYHAYKATLNLKKEQLEPLKKAEKLIKNKMTEYYAEQERKRLEEERRKREELLRQEEERRLKEAEETGDDSVLDKPIILPKIKSDKALKQEGISFQEVWKFRIVDKSKVPEEYKIIDEKKIGAVVRAMKQNTNIPGIEVYPEKIMRVKG